jgi:hypothetical protein
MGHWMRDIGRHFVFWGTLGSSAFGIGLDGCVYSIISGGSGSEGGRIDLLKCLV